MRDRYESNNTTYIINLKSQPKSLLEGILFAKHVLRNLPRLNERKNIVFLSTEAEVYPIRRYALRNFIWNLSILTDMDPFFTNFVVELLEGKLFSLNVPILRLTDMASKGIYIKISNPRAFRGKNVEKDFEIASRSNYRILMEAGKKVMRKLILDLNYTKSIIPKREKSADKFLDKYSRLLIPEAIRFNTTPLIAIWSEVPIISSRAHMIKIIINTKIMQNMIPKKIEKSLCAWFNSSFSILSLRSLFTTLEDNFGHIYGWHLEYYQSQISQRMKLLITSKKFLISIKMFYGIRYHSNIKMFSMVEI